MYLHFLALVSMSLDKGFQTRVQKYFTEYFLKNDHLSTYLIDILCNLLLLLFSHLPNLYVQIIVRNNLNINKLFYFILLTALLGNSQK